MDLKIPLTVLPLDIIVTILLKIPPECLFVLMCVGKGWRNLITSAEFIHKYFLHSAAEGKDYILSSPKYISPGSRFRLIPVESPENAFEKDIPFEFDTAGSQLVSASKGLVCLTDVSDFNVTIHLCNPFVRKNKTIRSSSIDVMNKDFTFVILGFGYHTRDNDYKIVRIGYTKNDYIVGVGRRITCGHDIHVDEVVHDHDNDTEVELYTLGTDSWRRINDVYPFPWFLHDLHARAFIKDCLHWIGEYNDGVVEKTVIVSFDLDSEVFQEMRLPNYQDEYDELHRGNNLVAYKGYLSFVAFFPPHHPEMMCSMWVMEEYGASDSWRLVFNIVDQIAHNPFLITNDDEILVDDDDFGVYFYNVFNHENRELQSFSRPDELDFLPVTPSLVFLETEEAEDVEALG